MEYIVKQLVDKMERNHLIMPDQIDRYIYVLQLKIESTVSALCLLILSYLFHVVMPTVFFLIAVSALKKRCGGIHADTFAQCLGSTVIIYIFFVKCIFPVMLENMRITFIIFLTAFMIVECIGAFNHPNMNWNREEYRKSKKLSRMMAFIEFFVTLMMLALKADLTIIIFFMFAMMLSAFLLILAKIFGNEVRL